MAGKRNGSQLTGLYGWVGDNWMAGYGTKCNVYPGPTSFLFRVNEKPTDLK